MLTLALALAANVVAMAPAKAVPQTFTVNSAADPGVNGCDATECTLREAITAANATSEPDTINFSIGTGGAHTIRPTTNLPPLADQVTIDGTTQPKYSGTPLIELKGDLISSGGTGLHLVADSNVVTGLVVNWFSTQQILVESSANTITSNYLGTNAQGTTVGGGGIFATLRIHSTDGGSASNNNIATNVIGGGQTRVSIEGYGTTSNNTLLRNKIGVGADGTALNGVGDGVTLRSNQGVITGNTLQENQIANNGAQGIDLEPDGVPPNDPGDFDSGPNNLQNYPVLTQATNGAGGTAVTGTLNSTPSTTFRVEFFSTEPCDPNTYGEGRSFVGSQNVTTDASGDADFTSAPFPNAPAGYQITSTATNTSTGDTSEFSRCQAVTAGPTGSPPGPPTGVAAAAGDAQAEVSWAAPDSVGDSPLASYTISSAPDSNGTPVTVPASATTTTILELANGTSYTFTVTAKNNDGLSSDPSTPSESVAPRSGAAPPESTTTEVAAGGGSLSTGDSATAEDPTNTSIQTPNGGTVSIAEGAMTGTHPEGGAYFGQQIDITAPDASANDPLTFTFVTDCSVLPAHVSSCDVGTSRAPLTTAPSPAGANVTVRDYGYLPRAATVGQGGAVAWSFTGAHRHSVTDSLGLGYDGRPMFNSGSKPAKTTYTRGFFAAGSFPYHSTTPGDPGSMTGTIRVPMRVSAATSDVAESVTIAWATLKPSAYRFDVQYRFKAPEGTAYGPWTVWKPNTQRLQASFTADRLKGQGSYHFRARLENGLTQKASLWSVPATVAVAPPRLDSVAMFHETNGVNVRVPECLGRDRIVDPAPTCVWSEEILDDGDLRTTVYTTTNGRWRSG